jgi:hypothetical protein
MAKSGLFRSCFKIVTGPDSALPYLRSRLVPTLSSRTRSRCSRTLVRDLLRSLCRLCSNVVIPSERSDEGPALPFHSVVIPPARRRQARRRIPRFIFSLCIL